MGRKLLTKNQLIEQTKKIEDPEERVLFVMHYFLDTVSYDYAYLLGAGYAQGSIQFLTGKKFLYKNPFKKEGDNLPEYLIKYQTDVLKGENGELIDHSDMVSDFFVLEKEVSSRGGNIDEYKNEIREYLKAQLNKHLDNPDLIEENIDRLMELLLKINGSQNKITVNGQEASIGYSFGYALMEIILQKGDIFPSLVMKDELISRGVCLDYSQKIVPLLQELGINAYDIGGTSELGHEWIIANINGRLKSLDLTRAVFIRDGFRGIPKNQTMEEWLYCDVKHSLDMQSTRTIREIGDMKLDKIIDAENYDEEEFKKLLQEYDEKNKKANNVSLGKLAKISKEKPIE